MNNHQPHESTHRHLAEVSGDETIGRFVVDATCRVIAFDPMAKRFLEHCQVWTLANGYLSSKDEASEIVSPQTVLDSQATVYIGQTPGDSNQTKWLATSRRMDEFSFELKIAEAKPFEAKRIADLGPVFGITRTEMLVVRAIVAGGNVDIIARQMGLSLNTVRTHIKRIHAKTGAHDTASLISLCLSFAI